MNIYNEFFAAANMKIRNSRIKNIHVKWKQIILQKLKNAKMVLYIVKHEVNDYIRMDFLQRKI